MCPSSSPGQHVVIIKVVRAHLTKSFEWCGFGKMDPYATVEWVNELGYKSLLSKTHTLWNAGSNPQWDYTCRGRAYRYAGDQRECGKNTNLVSARGFYGCGRGGQRHEEAVEISVYEDNSLFPPVYCGSGRASVRVLLGGDSDSEASYGSVKEVSLVRKGEKTGIVFVQARLVKVLASVSRTETKEARDEALSSFVTRVDPKMFVTPVRRLGMSGGTAPFFELKLRKPGKNLSDTYYIGKDLSRATDEIAFYEQMLRLKRQPGAGGLGPLLDYTLEYAGVLTAQEEGFPENQENPKELLVMRNLRDGVAKLRLLDLKIGQRTAQAGWQGKSRSHAYRQSLMDCLTNSYAEGFRLEGFEGRPPALVSRDPFIDLGGTAKVSGRFIMSLRSVKKAERMWLQSMRGSEIFMHLLDLHQEPGNTNVDLDEYYGSAELSEIVLHEMVRRLTRLAVVCHKVPVPQKWIGSSVALGFDIDRVPRRSKGEMDVRSSVIVSIFDWGRSELNTVQRNEGRFDTEAQLDRAKFWRYYTGGIDRLAWNAARAYYNRFCCPCWHSITIRILDFDSMSVDDAMGEFTVPAKATNGIKACQLAKKAVILYSVEWRAAPANSRLRGSWRIFLNKAQNLPVCDPVRGSSDPYCLVSATSKDCRFKLDQVTSVQPKTLNPCWDETLDLPVPATSNALLLALEEGGTGITHGIRFHELFKEKKSVRNLVRNGVKGARCNGDGRNSIYGMNEWGARVKMASIPPSRFE